MATLAGDEAMSDPLVEPLPVGLTRAGAVRVDAIDMLRGLVIALMVLDHVRDYFSIEAAQFDPVDPLKSYPLLFATRWVTHLCAPTFTFLAGVSIYFQRANGKAPGDLSRFLLTRGAWLVLLEATIISFGFNLAAPFFFLQTIWAIGTSMMAMAAIARLSSRAVLAIGVAILLLYPSVVPATAGAAGGWAILRTFLIAPGPIPGAPILAYYAIVPWLGVMCLGFGLGPLFHQREERRTRGVALLALGLLAAFVLLRSIDGYGDPRPWIVEPTTARTMMSYFNVSKYPPSPDYVCATLGVSMLLFLALQQLRGRAARVLLDFGRTPMFLYVCHIYIVHSLALATSIATGDPGATIDPIHRELLGQAPAEWGFPLPVTYAVWLLVLVLLVPLAHWMAGLKRRRRDWWLSYI